MQAREGAKKLPDLENSYCFGCGPSNEHGLKMQFYSDGTSVFSWFTVPEHYCGWKNLVHGGVISTLLDEIMGRAMFYLLRNLGMTRKISIDFLKPVVIGTEIKVQGRILEVKNTREAMIEGILSNVNGEVCAKAEGYYILFSRDKLGKMGTVADDVLKWLDHTRIAEHQE